MSKGLGLVQKKILEYLKENPKCDDTDDIFDFIYGYHVNLTLIQKQCVYNSLNRLKKRGLIRIINEGLYNTYELVV